MSGAKSERLMNLLIMLLSTRRFVTREEIGRTIAGYHRSSGQAFERQFERDKDELRGLGIRIQTGSNDPFFSDDEGYRIDRADFELPPIVFTPEERAVLAVAGRVWQDHVAAESTAHAFEALRAGGAEPDLALMPMLQPRIAGGDPGFQELLVGVTERRLVRFAYGDRVRVVQPWRLYQRRGRWYLLGHDRDAGDVRHFKLSRLRSEVAVTGKPHAFAVPADADRLTAHSRGEETGVVALGPRCPADLRHGARPVEWDGDLPSGFQAFEVSRPSLEALAQDLCAAGAAAIALAPTELRTQVVARLTTVAERSPV